MPSFVFNNSTSTYNAVNSGTMAAAAVYYVAPTYSTSATAVSVSSLGVRSGPAATARINLSTSTETPILRHAVYSIGSTYGNEVGWVTIISNSPYGEGNNIGDQATTPYVTYTRDNTVSYGKTRWVIPEYQGFLYGGPQSAVVKVDGPAISSGYARTDNAKAITSSSKVAFNITVPIGVDSGAVGTIGSIAGSGPWAFTISDLLSTQGFNARDIISAQARVGSFGTGNTVYITVVNTNSNSIGCLAWGGTAAPTAGLINSIYSIGEYDIDPTIRNITTITSASWSFTVIGLRGTSMFSASAGSGSVVSVNTSSESGGTAGAGNTVVVSAVSGNTQITCYATGSSLPRAGVIASVTTSGSFASYPFAGDATFVTTGTYSWVAPAGVTSVSVLAVGGGGGGGYTWSSGGGGGGGLGWKNNIAVTPGQSYTVEVGTGGPPSNNATDAAAAGGTSYFISTATVAGYGGGRGGPGANAFGGGRGGGFLGDGGGRGGDGAYDGSWTRGGGGAGGYSGQGADNGGGNTTSYPAASGSGGGGATGYYSSTYGTPAGGGVGIWGRGADGAGGSVYGGTGGSGGEQGVGGEGSGQQGQRTINGGRFGGGAGGSGSSTGWGGGWGGVGAVRIMWGASGVLTRSFPITNTGTPTVTVSVGTPTVKSSTIGGSVYNRESVSVQTNRMPYPQGDGIANSDIFVYTDIIKEDVVVFKLFSYQNLSAFTAGSKSITNSLTGSENFYVAGTGTDAASNITAYWF